MYTPENEHFGIVPVEAMYMGCIVLACNSGGPTESIVHGRTGFLLDADDTSQWGNKLEEIFTKDSSSKVLEQLKAQAKERVELKFSFRSFASQLVDIIST
mmetsp:Transcript_23380/g.20778  ORF Transcript_23380/g.20778 Transcript_23380/m.20778 type:complete len:100 (+) Transcript_23380:958-1257(+)